MICYTQVGVEEHSTVLRRDAHTNHISGYDRYTIYTHLFPQNSRTIDGSRHLATVPVKLMRSQNSKHQSHFVAMFDRTTFRHLKEIGCFLGSDQVTFH